MTKGKYAARAARRREDQDVQSEIGAYQHHVARLTAEVRDLTGKLAAERAARKDETRRLRAMLDEGLSPELIAVREELERQRQRADRAEATHRRARELRRRNSGMVMDVLTKVVGLSGIEAFELMLTFDPEVQADIEQYEQEQGRPITDGDLPVIADVGGLRAGKLTGEQIRRIQAARGIRHQGDAVKLVRDKLVGEMEQTS